MTGPLPWTWNTPAAGTEFGAHAPFALRLAMYSPTPLYVPWPVTPRYLPVPPPSVYFPVSVNVA